MIIIIILLKQIHLIKEVNKLKIFGICGFGDKRAWIFSFISTLGQIEKTMFITNNPMYKQLSESYTSEFEIAGIKIVVISGDYTSLNSYIDTYGYEFIIYDCIDNTPEYLDYILVLDNLDFYREQLPDDNKRIWIEKSLEDGNIVTSPFAELEKFITKIEKDKVLYPITVYKHLKSVSIIISEMLDIPYKEAKKYYKKSKAYL